MMKAEVSIHKRVRKKQTEIENEIANSEEVGTSLLVRAKRGRTTD